MGPKLQSLLSVPCPNAYNYSHDTHVMPHQQNFPIKYSPEDRNYWDNIGYGCGKNRGCCLYHYIENNQGDGCAHYPQKRNETQRWQCICRICYFIRKVRTCH